MSAAGACTRGTVRVHSKCGRPMTPNSNALRELCSRGRTPTIGDTEIAGYLNLITLGYAASHRRDPDLPPFKPDFRFEAAILAAFQTFSCRTTRFHLEHLSADLHLATTVIAWNLAGSRKSVRLGTLQLQYGSPVLDSFRGIAMGNLHVPRYLASSLIQSVLVSATPDDVRGHPEERPHDLYAANLGLEIVVVTMLARGPHRAVNTLSKYTIEMKNADRKQS